MNGNSAFSLPEAVPGPVGNPDVIRLLEQALVDARGGRMSSVAVVMVAGPGRVQAAAAGPAMFEMYVGCDQIKAALLANASGKASPILQVRR